MIQSTRKEDNRLVEVVNSYLDHVAYPQTNHLRFATRVTGGQRPRCQHRRHGVDMRREGCCEVHRQAAIDILLGNRLHGQPLPPATQAWLAHRPKAYQRPVFVRMVATGYTARHSITVRYHPVRHSPCPKTGHNELSRIIGVDT